MMVCGPLNHASQAAYRLVLTLTDPTSHKLVLEHSLQLDVASVSVARSRFPQPLYRFVFDRERRQHAPTYWRR